MKDFNKVERHEARELAVETLYAMDFNNQLDESLDLTLLPGKSEEEMSSLPDNVTIYAKFLIQGTLEHLADIDEIIGRYSINRPVEKINCVDRNILRISIFSMLYSTQDVHPTIIIDEAVKLSQSLSTDVAYKFINGVLDNIRKKEIH
ncbi:MAG: transcription antitermination factor NusB [Sphaerochaetaceae bacterium]|nr:transcription antitermination factor NusB [Sphaerochaetaceae bacterium]